MSDPDLGALRSDLARDGYCVLRQWMLSEAFDRVQSDILCILHSVGASKGVAMPSGDSFDDLGECVVALRRTDLDSYLASLKACNHLMSLAQLATTPEMTDLMSSFGLRVPTMATRTVLHFMADSLKIQDGYLKTPPHQDFRSVQGSLNSLIVWTPFADVGRNDYPLQVIPGSHLLGLLDAVDHPFGHEIEDQHLAGLEFVDVELERGDLVVFSSLLVHRTSENGGERVRLAASFRYNDACDPSYVARNLPIPYLYKPDMKLRTPCFPCPEEMADYARILTTMR